MRFPEDVSLWKFLTVQALPKMYTQHSMGRSDYNWQFENPLLPIVADGLPITGVHVCVIHSWVECIQEISLVNAYSYKQYKAKGLKSTLHTYHIKSIKRACSL